MSRTVAGERLFTDQDLETLRRLLWRVADFSGVEVLTYCLLSNHFHVLVRVPERVEVADAELLRRCRVLPPRGRGWTGEPGESMLGAITTALAAGGVAAETTRRALTNRMGEVSEFMKTLKQRFSVWFNHAHQRRGTLWSERFKSVLVENDPYALATVAAYIDLNPVRAGLVDDPKDYRFCGYGDAVGSGDRTARTGICSVTGCTGWANAQKDYRMILFGKGTEEKRDGTSAGTIAPEEAARVLNAGGHLPLQAVLRCRIRYFTDGAVLGSQNFVSAALRRYQAATSRRTRQCEGRLMVGADWRGLVTLRGVGAHAFG